MKEYLDPQKDVSLYLHIPFCTTKCDYCAFYSLPLSKRKDASCITDQFYEVLEKELTSVVEELKKPFRTIFIGGGNPGLLGPSRIKNLLDVAYAYGKSDETTMEINPETLDESFASLLSHVSRISIGIQSFSDAHLRTLGRNADRDANIRALRLLEAFKAESGLKINGDLITNIPRQSIEEALEDVETLSSFNIDHLSLYSLTFEEGSRLLEREKPLDEDEEADNLCILWDRLASLGFEQYEVSAFARGGNYCAHNLVYWNLGQYIGLGPSAESSLGYSSLVSMRQNEDVESFISSPSFDVIPLSKTEAVEEYLLTTLRTKWGVNKKEFSLRFEEDFDELFSSKISRLNANYYSDSEDVFTLKRDGILVMNQIILAMLMDL